MPKIIAGAREKIVVSQKMYRFILRPFLFLFDAEKVHHWVFGLLRFLFAIPGMKFLVSLAFNSGRKPASQKLFGLDFPNPVGLAAGFDKDGILNEKWEFLGFGFVEIGTVTPRAQQGNPKPRLFRLSRDKALLNRMGFNNAGVQSMAERLKKIRKKNIIIGGNIGKNKDTSNENALQDYLECFRVLFPYVDYFTINVSSPNTPGLRELQEKEPLKNLLSGIMQENRKNQNPKPVLLKISPDLGEGQLDDILAIVQETGLSGIVAGNTTLSRDEISATGREIESLGPGGISGKPLTLRSRELVRSIHQKTGGKIPIIGVGGIMEPGDAKAMMEAGASLVQVYTGFVYYGPVFAKRINNLL